MDVIKAVQFYVDKIVGDTKIDGMKALLLDDETTTIVSMVYTQSQILEKEVYLVERLGAKHERMTHLKAACYLRPNEANLATLKQELKNPKFSEYHIFFSNIVPQEMLQQLAEADELEVVRQVQEFYGDFLAINPNLFELDIHSSLRLCLPPQDRAAKDAIFKRTVDGITAVLLALKKKPVIRFQNSSHLARQVATQLTEVVSDSLFDFRQPSSAPVLLLLDRREDPVTPLLSQWTYQAQVHELLGIQHNRVNMENAPGITKDLAQVVLSITQDDFFCKHMHSNFGDLGLAVKAMLDEYQTTMKSSENIQSIEDMQRFVENYPAFKSQSINVSKHVALMGELARLVDQRNLMDVSSLEQELASNDAHSEQLAELKEKLASPQVTKSDKLRLALLYTLRYERNSNNKTSLVRSMLRDQGIGPDDVRLMDAVLEYGGAACRESDLYGDRSFLAAMSKNVKQGLQGVSNVYAQHTPLLVNTLEKLFKGKLTNTQFPCTNGDSSKDKPTDVIVFILGGCTYEEELRVAAMNEKGDVNVLLGGSCIQNSALFLEELSQTFGSGSNAFDLR